MPNILVKTMSSSEQFLKMFLLYCIVDVTKIGILSMIYGNPCTKKEDRYELETFRVPDGSCGQNQLH